VADASTGAFMAHFYRLRQQQHLSKAEALRQAQLAFLGAPPLPASTDQAAVRGRPVRLGGSVDTSTAPAFTPDPDHPYAHPYYWAPFILMGNWL
jgi:CHAT domain-containing protein